MPVNGNIDGETGGFQEVGEEVPFDHPRLGDAHLFSHLYRLFLLFHLKLGRRKRGRVGCQGVQHCLLAPKTFAGFFILFFTPLGWFSKTAQVEIVHLANLGVGMNMIPSSQHAATCSLCVMRNWTGRLDYLPSLPALIPHGIPRSAFPMYCSLLWVAPPPVLLGPSISPWLCPLTWGRMSLLIFLDLPQSGRLENWLGD